MRLHRHDATELERFLVALDAATMNAFALSRSRLGARRDVACDSDGVTPARRSGRVPDGSRIPLRAARVDR